jgi:hypothetical protein
VSASASFKYDCESGVPYACNHHRIIIISVIIIVIINVCIFYLRARLPAGIRTVDFCQCMFGLVSKLDKTPVCRT